MNLMNPKSSDVFPDPNSLQVTIFGQSAGAASVAWVNPFVILKPTAMIKKLWNGQYGKDCDTKKKGEVLLLNTHLLYHN